LYRSLTASAQGAPDLRSAHPSGSPAAESSGELRADLLERGEELGRVEAALALARSGCGRFVVVEGPAGIGKTALLAAVRTAAADSGMRVLRARANELEREFVFGVVRQLFEPPLADARKQQRANLLQGAAGVAAGLLALPSAPAPETARSTGVDPSFAILHGLYWLCVNLTAAAPLCLLVDDAQWADPSSLRYLAFLLTRLEELNVAIVIATRPREAGSDAGLLSTLTADPAAEVIRLRPLTRAALTRLIETRLAGDPDPVFVDACLRATRGTPFLVHALLGALAEAGIASSAEGAQQVERIGARSVGRSIHLQLRQHPEPAGRLARALAVLEQSDLHQAARLADLTDAEAARAADLLTSTGMFEPGRPLRFIHPIVRTALYDELSGIERNHGHRRAARLLADQPGASERVAQHLLASEPAGDAWVVERLSEAARTAARSGAPESAAVFLRRVLEEPAPPADQSGLLVELGVAEASAGLAGWREHLQQAIDTAPNATAATGAARELARAFNRSQCFGEAVDVLDRAASALNSGQDELALQLEAAAVVAGMNDLAPSPSFALRQRVLRERAARNQAATCEVLGAAAYVSILVNEPAAVGADLTRRALAGEDAAPCLQATFARTALSLLWTERYAELLPLLDASITEARRAGDSGRLAVGLAARSWLALRRGDLCAAAGDARTALAATELPAPRMYRVLNAGLLADALLELGELEEAAQLLARFDADTESVSLTSAVLRLARGRLGVAQGRHAEGLEDLLAVGSRLTGALVSCPSFLPWRSEAALAQLALGRRELAARLADEELELARAFGTPRAIGVAARAVGVVAGGERGELLLREAIDAFTSSGSTLEQARALADLGAMLRRRNRRTEARELLRESLDTAHRAGARRLADFAETELRATGARPRRQLLRGLESLTASERRIAEFASQGLTNREIAQTLFVTTRTVEGHLTSIFRKLQLDSRSDLRGALTAGSRHAA
jgi:DNA-binding CsgD family transcriptional regulator